MKVPIEDKEKEPSNYLVFLFLIIILIRRFRKFVGFLTQYFPFSLITDRLNSHNKNKEKNTASDLIRDKTFRLGMYFDTDEEADDQHFIYISGKFTYRKKGGIEKLIAEVQEALGETNFYVKKINEKNFKGSLNEAEKLGKIKPLF